jgi:hypothetical protein
MPLTEEVKMEVLEANVLIAEFMEWPTIEGQDLTFITPHLNYTSEKTVMTYTALDMKFDSSWEWLMPVVEKIESLGYDFTIAGKTARTLEQPCVSVGDTKLLAVFYKVVEFLQWYRTNKTTQIRLLTAQEIAIRCAYADLVGAYQAMARQDYNVHDWSGHQSSIEELEDCFPDIVDPIKLPEANHD